MLKLTVVIYHLNKITWTHEAWQTKAGITTEMWNWRFVDRKRSPEE